MTIRWSGIAASTFIAVAAALAGCGPQSRAPSSTVPVVSVTTPEASDPAMLPTVTGTGVRALWQGAPWNDLTFAGRVLLGVNGHQVEAISAVTGKPLWSAAIALPSILGLVPAGDLVIVEAGPFVGQPPAAVYPAVSEYLALDLATGAMRWAVHVRGQYQSPAIAVSGQYLLTGDPSGAVTARIAATGQVVWRDRRPRACGPPPGGEQEDAGLGIAADGPLLAVSFECGPRVIAARLDPATGEALWTWRSPAANAPELSVANAALDGGLVLISGQISPSARPFAGRLPRARAWPQALGPNDETELIVALDASTGRPRWSEVGGQLETFAPTAGALCELVNIGLECRDDVTGTPTMSTLLTGKAEGDSPPYSADGYAGVSGGLAVVTVPSRHGVMLRVIRVRGGATVARARLAIGTRPYGGANYQVFAIAAGPFGDEAILVLLRRVDLPGYPVLALEVG